MRPPHRLVLLLVCLLGQSLLASAVGDFGPDTCLQGWVWREAYVNDHVCVTPAVRTQASSDNAQAANRRNADGSCKPGYVWREARQSPLDKVCVVPAVRTQTKNDNLQAANRRASLVVWTTKWFPPPVCHDGVCTVTSVDDIPRIQINGDHFNFGSVTANLYRSSDNALLFTKALTASFHSGYVAGSFGVHTNSFDCSAFPGSKDGYVRVYDSISNRWSAKVNVKIGCTVL